MGDQADMAADLAAPFVTGSIPPEFDDEYDGPGTAFAEPDAPTARDAAVRLMSGVQQALAKAEHLPCTYAEFASLTTDDESGKLAVVCGCGFIADGEGLINTNRTLTDADVEVRPGNTVTVHGADPIARTAALIPQGAHYTPEMLEHNILDVLERLEKGGAFERLCIEQEAAAKTAYTVAYARAYASQQGPVETRNQLAIVETIAELQARDEAIMVAKAVKASMHNLRSVLSGYQTINASLRAAYGAGGSPGKR